MYNLGVTAFHPLFIVYFGPRERCLRGILGSKPIGIVGQIIRADVDEK
jgi:hypothetical protein